MSTLKHRSQKAAVCNVAYTATFWPNFTSSFVPNSLFLFSKFHSKLARLYGNGVEVSRQETEHHHPNAVTCAHLSCSLYLSWNCPPGSAVKHKDDHSVSCSGFVLFFFEDVQPFHAFVKLHQQLTWFSCDAVLIRYCLNTDQSCDEDSVRNRSLSLLSVKMFSWLVGLSSIRFQSSGV